MSTHTTLDPSLDVAAPCELDTARRLDVLQSMLPRFEARAAETETARTMPVDLADECKREGLFTLLLPRSLGGAELDVLTFLEVIEGCARADGAAGWNLLISNATVFMAWLEPGVAHEMIGDGQISSSASFAPHGRAVRSDHDLHLIHGRWGFNSACIHADWCQQGVTMMDGEHPRMLPSGPDHRFAIVPRRAITVIDTWDTIGLRGTGSHDIALDGVAVPETHLTAPFTSPAPHDGPLWRLPFIALLPAMMVGIPLGIARRALDEFVDLAPRKQRTASSSVVSSDAHVQVEFARAEADVAAARAFAIDALGETWDTACIGDVPSAAATARIGLASTQAMAAALRATTTIYSLAGGSVIYSDDVLGRCFRDLHTASHHVAFSHERFANYASGRFATSG